MSENKAECDCEHQAISEEIEAVQNELGLSVDKHAQGQEIQAAPMDAMGYRIVEKKDPLMQRELGMESQMQEMCSQFQTMGTNHVEKHTTSNRKYYNQRDVKRH